MVRLLSLIRFSRSDRLLERRVWTRAFAAVRPVGSVHPGLEAFANFAHQNFFVARLECAVHQLVYRSARVRSVRV